MRYTLLLLTISLSLFTFSQNVIWSDNYKLKYEDFQKTPPTDQNVRKAETAAKIEIKPQSKPDGIEMKIYCYFKKNESWMRNDYKNQYTLDHEQGHFDIAEIHVRRLRKELQETKVSRVTGGKKIKRICKKHFRNMMSTQREYDNATSYSVREENQKMWVMKITRELKELDTYKSTVVMVKFK